MRVVSLLRHVRRMLGRLSRRPDWHEVADGPAAGCEMYLDPGASPSFRAMLAGSYDRDLYAWLGERGLDLDSAVVWDVGAHFGYHSLALAGLTGAEGRVVAFEPNPHVREVLEGNLRRNPLRAERIRIAPMALGAESCEKEIKVACSPFSPRSTGGFVDGTAPPLRKDAYAGFEARTVPVMKGDDWITEEGGAPPSLMKIDVEGAEDRVLAGCSALLGSAGPVLLAEVHTAAAMYRVLAILKGMDYTVELIDTGEEEVRAFLGCHRDPRSSTPPSSQ